jgi:hypothetical protein
MAGPPFSTFGLDIDISFVASAGEAAERFGDLREFGQSRQGAYTAKIEGQLFPSPPRLLTTVNLEMSVSGDRRSALDVARERAERKLLASELAKGLRHEEVAARLGIGRAELHRLLVAHGLLEQPRAFAIALPEQLALSSD